MPSYYWAKIWIDVLDDHKLGPLDDHLWRRFFEFVLLAKEEDNEGALPDLRAMAWRLRTTEAELRADLEALSEVCDGGLLYCADGTWYVTNFAKRQDAPMDDAERQRRKRERDRHAEYEGTEPSRASHADVTERDTDQIRSETEQTTEQSRADNNTPVTAQAVDNPVDNSRTPVVAVVDDPLYAELLAYGVTQGKAQEIVAHRPREHIRGWLDHCRSDNGSIRNPAAFLVDALLKKQHPPPKARASPEEDRKRYVKGKFADVIRH